MKVRIGICILAIVPILLAMQNCGGASSSNGDGQAVSSGDGVSSNNVLNGSCIVTPSSFCYEYYAPARMTSSSEANCKRVDANAIWTNGGHCGTGYNYKCNLTAQGANGAGPGGWINYYLATTAGAVNTYSNSCSGAGGVWSANN